MYNAEVFKLLIGQTPIEITGMKQGSDAVEIETREGNTLTLRYEPDCCANCEICQVDGDPEDLLGSPLVMAENVTDGLPEDGVGEYVDSCTWTFVKFATVKGYVTLRWYGESNGYYSEEPSAYYNGTYDGVNKHYSFTGRWSRT